MKNRFRPIKVIINFCKKLIELDYHVFDKTFSKFYLYYTDPDSTTKSEAFNKTKS